MLLPPGSWRMDPLVSTITGLNRLEKQASAQSRREVQGSFTMTGGAITLQQPGSQVVVGLPYPTQLSPALL